MANFSIPPVLVPSVLIAARSTLADLQSLIRDLERTIERSSPSAAASLLPQLKALGRTAVDRATATKKKAERTVAAAEAMLDRTHGNGTAPKKRPMAPAHLGRELVLADLKAHPGSVLKEIAARLSKKRWTSSRTPSAVLSLLLSRLVAERVITKVRLKEPRGQARFAYSLREKRSPTPKKMKTSKKTKTRTTRKARKAATPPAPSLPSAAPESN